ncbi:MAG TPA: ABC transporter permease [Candidatus Sulfotelmatobacter sp.]|nr:ABC transporter permease [Candidatus Sulfotelmatobacter sp.]
MNWLREVARRLRMLVHRRQFDADLEEEMQLHLELRQQEHLESGMNADSARAAARRRFGNVTALREKSHIAWGWEWFENLVQDVGYGLRMLRKNPGFTSVSVLTLALGIGANTAIFSVINGVLLSPLPYKNPQQLVVRRGNDSPPNVRDIQRQARAFSEGGGINVQKMDYTGGTEPVQVRTGLVDAGFLETLGVQPMLGRIISPSEDMKGGPRLAVASYSFWQNFLGSDPHAVGKAIPLGGNTYTVIGVMPASFAPPAEHADVFVSMWAGDPGAAAERDVHFMHTYWRLQTGVALAQAQAEMAAIDRRLAEQYPAEEKERKTQLVPLHEWLVGDVRPALLVLFGAVGLVLLIACANFASLLMAREVARRQELVIRAALGAGRGRLIRKTLTESALLSVLGGVAGLLLAQWGTRMLLALRPEKLARLSGIHMDTRVLLFVLAVSVLTGVVFGMAPAWVAARGDVAEALNESGRSTTASAMGHRIRNILVTSELALALVLLVGAGLLIKGFSRLRSMNPGFNPANVMTMYLQLPATRYAEIPKQTQFRRELLARLNSLPGLQAAMVTDIPLGGNYVGHGFVIDGHPPVAVGGEPDVQTLSVMGDYFRVMQIPLRAGRDFTPLDREGQPLVAIVSEEVVREFFPHENPIGARIHWARETEPPQWMTVIGVVADVKHSGLDQPVDPAVYTPFPQSNEIWRSFMTLAIRTGAVSSGLVEEVKKQVWSLDSRIPVNDVHTMDELMAVSLAQQRFNMLLLGLFAALALVLAAVGIYGMMAYRVGQRMHEIGIHIALGAQRRDVLRLVLVDGAKLACFGIAIGIASAIALTRLMTSLLFEVKPTDPETFAVVVIVLAIVALAACYAPARRAMRVDPMVALRYE